MSTIESKIIRSTHAGMPVHRVENLLTVQKDAWFEADEDKVSVTLGFSLIEVKKVIVCIMVPLKVTVELFNDRSVCRRDETSDCPDEYTKIQFHLNNTLASRIIFTAERIRFSDNIRIAYLWVSKNGDTVPVRPKPTVAPLSYFYPEGKQQQEKPLSLKRAAPADDRMRGGKARKDNRGRAVESRVAVEGSNGAVKHVLLCEQDLAHPYDDALCGFVLTTTATGERRDLVRELVEALGAVYMDTPSDYTKYSIVDSAQPTEEQIAAVHLHQVPLVSWHWLFQCQELCRAVDATAYIVD